MTCRVPVRIWVPVFGGGEIKKKEFLDIFGPWLLVIAFVVIFITTIAPNMPESVSYDNGICTEKIDNGTGYYIKIDDRKYQIDSQLYKGVLVGEQYDISYYPSSMMVNDVDKYTRDSGF